MYYQYRQPYEVVKHPICRFLVQGLSSNKGRAKNDFHVDVVLTVDGLLTLVKSVFGVLNKHHRISETYRSLRWRLHFHGDVFTLADPDIHSFRLLQYPLRNGQTGWFEGSNASFRFSVLSVQSGEICSSKLACYPKILVAPSPTQNRSFTPEMREDWLSEELKVRAKDHHRRFREYMSGANVWNQDASGDYFRDRPKPPKWTPQEEDILALLIHSGYKFQESWLSILQYCFVNRSEVGTAQQWYKVRKRQFSDSSHSDQSPKEDMIMEAKSLCLDHLELQLKARVPELGEHPLKRKNNTTFVQSQESNTLSATKRRKVTFSPPTSDLGAEREQLECEARELLVLGEAEHYKNYMEGQQKQILLSAKNNVN
jgi:hypothetical protein